MSYPGHVEKVAAVFVRDSGKYLRKLERMYIRTTEGPGQQPLQYNLADAPSSSRAAERRFKRVASLVTDGLKLANAAIPKLTNQAPQDLLRFLTSLLETNFFPRGHGLGDAKGNVLRQSKIGTVAIPVSARDGSCWPRFEYRFRVSLDDRILDPKVNGRHLTALFSNILLFTHALERKTPSHAVLTALHEMTHMMFAMIRSLERLCGADTVRQFLSRQPWRMFDLGGFASHRGNLERHTRDLLRVLPIPLQAAELAASLVEEAFAFMFAVIVDEAIDRSFRAKKKKREPGILPTFSAEGFVTTYMLEKAFYVTPEQLKSAAVQEIFQRMTGDVEALASALRTHIEG